MHPWLQKKDTTPEAAGGPAAAYALVARAHNNASIADTFHSFYVPRQPERSVFSSPLLSSCRRVVAPQIFPEKVAGHFFDAAISYALDFNLAQSPG